MRNIYIMKFEKTKIHRSINYKEIKRDFHKISFIFKQINVLKLTAKKNLIIYMYIR